MHVFYTPDIQKTNELPEEEAQHCNRVSVSYTQLDVYKSQAFP